MSLKFRNVFGGLCFHIQLRNRNGDGHSFAFIRCCLGAERISASLKITSDCLPACTSEARKTDSMRRWWIRVTSDAVATEDQIPSCIRPSHSGTFPRKNCLLLYPLTTSFLNLTRGRTTGNLQSLLTGKSCNTVRGVNIIIIPASNTGTHLTLCS